MDVSMQLRDLANAVGEDFAMNAPDDAAKLVGKARRGRMVWGTGVGAVVVGSAASLAFGGPALASALSSGPAVAPAASDSATPMRSVTGSVAKSPSATPSTPPTTSAPRPGDGTIDLIGGATVGGSDNSYDDHSDDSYNGHGSDDHSDSHDSEPDEDD